MSLYKFMRNELIGVNFCMLQNFMMYVKAILFLFLPLSKETLEHFLWYDYPLMWTPRVYMALKFR